MTPIYQLVLRGASITQAADIQAVEQDGLDLATWASLEGRGDVAPRSVEDSIRRGKKALGEQTCRDLEGVEPLASDEYEGA